MILKLIVIGAILYGLYRLVGGRILPESKDSKEKKGQQKGTREDEENTLVECDRCSTYVVKKEAIFFKGKYYCSRECLDAAK